MRYAAIEKCEICNGNNVGVSLYVQGCPIHCNGCFNQSTWDFNGGNEWNDETMNKLLSLIKLPHIHRISILGGEPLAEENIYTVFKIIERIENMKKDNELSKDFKIWLYTGYSLEMNEIFNCLDYNEMFNCLDYIVDGPYINELRDITLKFRGSSNQRIIDCKASIKAGKMVTAFE